MAPESLELFSDLSIRENQSVGTLVGSILVMDRDGDLDEFRGTPCKYSLTRFQ